jgi:syntenin-1
MQKDSNGHCGFQFHKGKIETLVKDSSAARNGLVTDHYLLEVQGQNVIGMSDKEILKVIANAGNTITVTIIPAFLYEQMMKK